jgi:Zn-dependent membrane protease YugP
MEIFKNIYKYLNNLFIDSQAKELKLWLINNSFPIFAEYDRDRRNFFSMLATISATIGAFSFLLFSTGSIVKNIQLLKIGDGLLLITIIFSISTYLFILSDSQKKFHKVYYDSLEIFNNKEYEKLPKYRRPKVRNYLLEFIICSIFVFALIFIGMSFF